MNVKLNSEGSVLCQWVKMGINERSASFYHNSPGYYLISKDTNNKIFAFRRPMFDEPLPHHLEVCNELETKKLEDKAATWQ